MAATMPEQYPAGTGSDSRQVDPMMSSRRNDHVRESGTAAVGNTTTTLATGHPHCFSSAGVTEATAQLCQG
jgi:hypothetical protein